jgi:hypothetical protein
MQANPKPSEGGSPAEPKAAETTVTTAAAATAAHPSPARALQARLVKELTGAPTSSWTWHSAGLVLTTLLALWFAGLMLNAGV